MNDGELRKRHARERRGKILIKRDCGGFTVYCLKKGRENVLREGFSTRKNAMAFAGSDEAWALYQDAESINRSERGHR